MKEIRTEISLAIPLYSGWRRFCRQWWKERLSPSTYWRWLRFAYQRFTRGYTDYDWWGLDRYLSVLLPAMLRQLRDHHHGVPVNPDITTDDPEAGYHDSEEWVQILNEMIDGFEAMRQIIDYEGLDSPYEETYRPWYDARIAKFQRAMELLGKYYLALWD